MLMLERHVGSSGYYVWSGNSLIVQNNRKRVSFSVVFVGDFGVFYISVFMW